MILVTDSMGNSGKVVLVLTMGKNAVLSITINYTK